MRLGPRELLTARRLRDLFRLRSRQSQGDLNGDGVSDLLLVLRMNDPKNVVKNDGLGPDELDTNPRMLVVAFADNSKKYRLVVADHTLIPRHTNPRPSGPATGD